MDDIESIGQPQSPRDKVKQIISSCQLQDISDEFAVGKSVYISGELLLGAIEKGNSEEQEKLLGVMVQSMLWHYNGSNESDKIPLKNGSFISAEDTAVLLKQAFGISTEMENDAAVGAPPTFRTDLGGRSKFLSESTSLIAKSPKLAIFTNDPVFGYDAQALYQALQQNADADVGDIRKKLIDRIVNQIDPAEVKRFNAEAAVDVLIDSFQADIAERETTKNWGDRIPPRAPSQLCR